MRDTRTTRTRPARLGACVGVLAAALLATLVATSGAATGSTVVGATVPSATTVDVAGCPSRTDGITSFGTVQPGDAQVTTLDCTVLFGSSNDTARLRSHLFNDHRILTIAVDHADVQGLRISPSVYTLPSEIDRFCDVVEVAMRDGLPA